MIIQYIISIGVMVLLVGFFAFALNFSKYKKRNTSEGCCGGGHCGSGDESHTCGCYDEKSQFVKEFSDRHKHADLSDRNLLVK